MPKGVPRVNKEVQQELLEAKSPKTKEVTTISGTKETLPVKAGRNKKYYKSDIPYMLNAIEISEGTETDIAAKLDLSTTALRKYFTEFPELQEAYLDKKREKINSIESWVYKTITEENPDVDIKTRADLAKFMLSTVGGYSTKTRSEQVVEKHTFNWSEQLQRVKKDGVKVDEIIIEDSNGW